MPINPLLRFPGGRLLACTTSWDDGRAHDRRVVEIFNRHGIKGTFNLNSSTLGVDRGALDPNGPYVTAEEVARLYAGHEVAVHSWSHPHPSRIPPQSWLREVIDDRARLEDLVQYPVRGAAWPFGDFNAAAVAMLRAAGIVHCRTVRSHGGFALPEADAWLTWDPTCHHRGLPRPDGGPDRLWADFTATPASAWNRHARLFYLWSHSYELPRDDGWAWLEAWAARAGACSEVWHATNIAIHDYVEAWRRLAFTWDGRRACNLSALPLWVGVGERTVEIPAGATVAL